MFQTSAQEHLSIILDFSLSFALKWHQIKSQGFYAKRPFQGILVSFIKIFYQVPTWTVEIQFMILHVIHPSRKSLVNNNPRYARQFPKKNLPRTRFRVSSTPPLVKKNYVHFTKSVTTNNHFIYINQYLLKILFALQETLAPFRYLIIGIFF